MMHSNNTFRSWIPVSGDSDFSLANLPYGIGRKTGQGPRAFTRIGDTAIDLASLARHGFLQGSGLPAADIFERPTLNDFIGLGKAVWQEVRQSLLHLFQEDNPLLREDLALQNDILHPVSDLEMAMPVHVGDYTDFYSSIEHATNVGIMFRDPSKALLPNWKHIPVGYHGRSSSIVISGTPVHRPKGQTKADDQEYPTFGPSRQLDFELEIAFITGGPTDLGDSIPVTEAEDHIFGLVLFNDLSARDIQKWEYVPLGPFLSKNFGSVISPWVITLDAWKPFRVEGPLQEPAVLPYLQQQGARNIDIRLEVDLIPQGGPASRICDSNFRHMYWSMAQQLAHHTVNGCNIRPGDMMASGTISGPEPGSYGSMLELAWRGTRPLVLKDGSTRTFIQDHDTIRMRGYTENDGVRVGFGECVTTILPSKH